MRTPRSDVYIRLAIDSVVYAPLYVFQDMQRKDSDSRFRFKFKPTVTEITPADPIQFPGCECNATCRQLGSRGFAPTAFDPTFSPVVDRAYFPQFRSDWFAVGDPVRIRRLVLSRVKPNVSGNLVGSLIVRPAYWVVVDRSVQCDPSVRRCFNLVACQPRGTTGFHLADLAFRGRCQGCPEFDSLAPTARPGAEVDYYFRLLEAEHRFRKSTQPAQQPPKAFAVVTPDIGRIQYQKSRRQLSDQLESHPVAAWLPDDINSHSFIMTGIVARHYDQEDEQKQVDEASRTLRAGVAKAISLLRDDVDKFLFHLGRCYVSHGGFTPPDAPTLGLFRASRHFSAYVAQLKDFYNQSKDLTTDAATRRETDSLLGQSIESDLRHFGSVCSHTKEYVLDRVGTHSWTGISNEW